MMVLGSGLFACGQIAGLRHVLSISSKSLIAPQIVTAIVGVSQGFVDACQFGVAGVVAAGVYFGAVYCVWVVLAMDRTGRPKPPALSLVLDRVAPS